MKEIPRSYTKSNECKPCVTEGQGILTESAFIEMSMHHASWKVTDFPRNDFVKVYRNSCGKAHEFSFKAFTVDGSDLKKYT